MKKKFTDRSKELITQSFDLETNVIMGHPSIEINGINKIRIENHKGIVKYTPENILVNTVLAAIDISGKNLHIVSLMSDEIIIHGEINGVKYIL
ncbi:MAG: hypothetical protein E7218_08880 [Anaerofustis stercorihominis]|nr:hypothetical protein [Anaerofustis stercorihominis]